MAKLTLTPISSITNEESFVANYNENMARIEDAVEQALFRNGTSPNTMTDDLDMNSFHIINVPAPLSDNDLVRLVDVAEGIKGDQGDQGPPGSATLSDSVGAIEAAEPASADKFFVWSGSDVGSFQTITTAGRALIDDAAASDQRTTLGLGNSATLAVGTTASTVAAGDDTRFSKYVINTKNQAYAFVLADTLVPTLVYHSEVTARAYTINPNSTTAYPVGCQLLILNGPTGGAITLTRGAGVTLYVNGSTTSANATISPGGYCTAIQPVTDVWYCSGPGVA